jgi:hypothetical protein
MPKQQTLKTVKDNSKFRISKVHRTQWTLIGKNGKTATINSQGGLTRFVPLSTKVYAL